VTVLNSPGVSRYGEPGFGTGRDVAGVVLFVVGFVMESVSDAQRVGFREEGGRDGLPCDVEFWGGGGIRITLGRLFSIW
jgi:steroid 5-alpha reductase family enzyme